jgi:hypothetical protein
MSFCARGKFWEKEPHTHSPPPPPAPPSKCGRCVQQFFLSYLTEQKTLVKDIKILRISSFGFSFLRSLFSNISLLCEILDFLFYLCFLLLLVFYHNKRVCCVYETCLCFSEFPGSKRLIGKGSVVLN